jgi:hypothetical protein
MYMAHIVNFVAMFIIHIKSKFHSLYFYNAVMQCKLQLCELDSTYITSVCT